MTWITRFVQRLWFYLLVKHGFYLFARVFLRLRIEGRERIPTEGGLVVASNHISALDPPVMGVSIPREVHYMAKRELFENRYLRALVLGLRSFPVDRSGHDIGAIKEALRRLERGLAIGIFAQGTRNVGNAQALDGAAFLAQRAGVPLLPAAVWREGWRYRVRFGEPIMPRGRSREEVKTMTEELMRRVDALLPEHKRFDRASAVVKPTVDSKS